MELIFVPIATVKNNRTEIKDDYWGSVVSEIELAPHIPVESLTGLDTFSHLEIIFHFHLLKSADITYCGHPRENPTYPIVGIFAQRKKNRPNSIGTTIVELLKISNRSIFVKNLDANNGTPVLDIKPILKEFLPQTTVKQPQWSTDLMKNYWLE